MTRAQMAVFIARAAEAAGVDLGGAGNARFNDIDDTWQEAQDAINQLATTGGDPLGRRFQARRRHHPGRDGDVPGGAAGRVRAGCDEGLQRRDPAWRARL